MRKKRTKNKARKAAITEGRRAPFFSNQLTGIFLLSASLFSTGCFLEQKAKPVYFSAHPTLFTDTIFPVQTIYPVSGARLFTTGMEEVELKKGEVVKASIRQPLLIRKGPLDEALIYPNEHIFISGDNEKDSFAFSILPGNTQRNRELQVLTTFQRLQRQRRKPVPWWHALPEYNLQTVLELEQQVKESIPLQQAASQRLFDSVLTAFDVSKKFREDSRDYIQNRYDFNLLWLYRLYKDTLSAYGLYLPKLRALVPGFSAIKTPGAFNDNLRSYLDELIIDLFPVNRMISMQDEEMFRACFDSIQNNFSGIAKDYLLSRTMARAYEKGFAIPTHYTQLYKNASRIKAYRIEVNNRRNQHKKEMTETAGVANRVVEMDGKKEMLLEVLISGYKGRYVLIDCWASWCQPCLREMPRLKELAAKYSTDQIAFLALSFDQSSVAWRKEIFRQKMETLTNFRLLNTSGASFVREQKIETIPRYLLFDRDGKIVLADAPSPSNPALEQLLDSLVKVKPGL